MKMLRLGRLVPAAAIDATWQILLFLRMLILSVVLSCLCRCAVRVGVGVEVEFVVFQRCRSGVSTPRCCQPLVDDLAASIPHTHESTQQSTHPTCDPSPPTLPPPTSLPRPPSRKRPQGQPCLHRPRPLDPRPHLHSFALPPRQPHPSLLTRAPIPVPTRLFHSHHPLLACHWRRRLPNPGTPLRLSRRPALISVPKSDLLRLHSCRRHPLTRRYASSRLFTFFCHHSTINVKEEA